MNYVCGFLFHPPSNSVALIEKKKPAWQYGKLNGIGGKIEVGENPLSAMIREFAEETSVMCDRWKLIRVERFANGAPDGEKTTNVYFFSATATHGEWEDIMTMEEEEIIKWRIDYSDTRLMYNLPYLLPMCKILAGEAPERVPTP